MVGIEFRGKSLRIGRFAPERNTQPLHVMSVGSIYGGALEHEARFAIKGLRFIDQGGVQEV
jgi:hypothetical protein